MSLKRSARYHLPEIGALLLGLLITFLLVWTDYQGQRQMNEQLMKRHAQVYSNAVKRALERGQSVVEDLMALFNASSQVSRRKFTIFTRTQLKHHSSIQALEWIPRVPAELRQTYEQQARLEVPGFQFTDLDAQGQLTRAGTHDVYFPVYYVSPLAGNEAALGYIASQQTQRNQAIEQATVSAQTISSGSIRLIQEKQNQLGLLVFSPVFQSAIPPESAEQRRQTLKGFVMAVFRIGDLIEMALAAQDKFPLEMVFSDLDTINDRAFLYHYQAGAEHHQRPGLPPQYDRSLITFTDTWRQLGHRWQLEFYPQQGAYAIDWQGNLLLLSFGTLLTMVIAFAVGQWSRQQVQLQRRIALERDKKALKLKKIDQTLIRQNRALNHLTSNPKLLQQQLTESLSDITRVTAETLNVARASVWLLSDDHQLIRCFDLYERHLHQHSSGIELRQETYPAYFEALLTENSIIANDPYQDPRTAEFGQSYLSVIGITGMLDVPIRRETTVVGVLCCEHVGPSRQWTTNEEHFCHSVANIISLAMESIERRQAEQRLQQSSARLAMINTIATHVTAGMTVQQVITIALERLSDRFPQFRVSYSTISEQGTLSVQACCSPSSMPDITDLSVDLNQAPEYLEILQQKQPLLVTDVNHDQRVSPLKGALLAGNTQAILDMPLLHGLGLVGLLCFDHCVSHFWTENEILTLQETAEYLEFAIREARGQEAREKAENALEKHKANLEQLVHQRTQQLEHQAEFERLVAELSTQFIRLPAEQLTAAIHDALARIGKFSNVDRCSLCQWHKDAPPNANHDEWLSEGTTSMFNHSTSSDFSNLSWLTQQLHQKKPVYFADLTQLPTVAKNEQHYFRQRQVRSLCVIPLLYGLELFGVLIISTQFKTRTWTDNDVILLKLFGEMLVNACERKKYEEALKKSESLLLESNKILEDLATIDALTGVANRRFFELRFLSDFQRVKRDGNAIALIFFDIDYFKHYNDHWGHPAGDRCLKEVATTLGKLFQRATEAVVRYGGEEFVAILTNCSQAETEAAAERARRAVEELHIPQSPDCPSPCVTLSCGVAWNTPTKDDLSDELVEAADSALYQAKNAGRNCVKIAP